VSDDADDAAARTAHDFVGTMVPQWEARLGAELIGISLIGSLAHGGFSARYSDIDVALVTQDGLAPDTLEALRAQAVARSTELAPKLSFFWADRGFTRGRFPPLDRADYLDHGIALLERERVLPPRPLLADLRQYLAGAPLANWRERAERFAADATLEPKDRKPFLRALLYPARFAYSFMTGRMASNDVAVGWVRDRAVPGIEYDLIARALACRKANADPDPLFADRSVLLQQIAACAQLVANSEATSR
jgi:predicted nucleotidyltransferase